MAIALLAIPTVAVAAPRAVLTAGFSPERLGAGTTISFGLRITAPAGQEPDPLSGLELLYPHDLGLSTSGLGFSTCQPATLQSGGPEACPVDSVMGYGSAVVEVPIGPRTVREQTSITVLSGPVQNGHIGLLFYAKGLPPIAAQFIFSGAVLPEGAPFGGNLDINMPPVPSVPEGPNAAIVELHSTLGPAHVTYTEQRNGKTVRYHPRGIQLPASCPRGGFPFSAQIAFADAVQSTARTVVPCPPTRR